MKRLALILLFALGVALAGCVKVESITPAEEISYAVGAYTPSTTKATLNSEGITQFNSKAWLHTPDGTSALYGDGETISYINANAVWSPSRTYYWPKNPRSYVNFISWYDNGGTPTVTENAMAWTARTIAASDNIMFADMAWRYKSGQVPTLFHHALAQVKFQAQATSLSAGGNTYAITINSVTLNNVHKKGTLSLSSTDPGSCGTVAWTTQGWVPDSQEVLNPISLSLAEPVSVTESPCVIMDFSSVLPQATADITVSLSYTIRTNRGNDHYISESMTTNISLSTFDDWTMNHRTTYTISFSPATNIIKFVPSTEDWRVDATNTLYVE